jgi:hypothetical protein
MKRFLCLLFTGAAVFCLCVSTAWLGADTLLKRTAPTDTASAAPYTLGELNGQAALYANGSTAPLAVYEIYTALLPPDDAALLRRGIPLDSEYALRCCLEDLGA